MENNHGQNYLIKIANRKKKGLVKYFSQFQLQLKNIISILNLKKDALYW